MADYLNPDAMLTPLGSQGSMYAPSYDQMLMSDIKRRMQAEETLRHMNMMNEQDRLAKPWQTQSVIEEAKQKAGEARMLADPEMINLLRQSKVGGYQQDAAKGRLAESTVDSQIAVMNAANQLGATQAGYTQSYYPFAELYDMLQPMITSGMPTKDIQGNINRYIKNKMAGNQSWLNPMLLEPLMQLSNNPVALLKALEDQRSSVRTQPEQFKLTEIATKGWWDAQQAADNAANQKEPKPSDYSIILQAVKSDPAWADKTPRQQTEEASRIYSGRTAASYGTEVQQGWVALDASGNEVPMGDERAVSYVKKSKKTTGATASQPANTRQGTPEIIEYDSQGNRK